MKLWGRRGGRRKIAVLIGEASTITGKCIFRGTTVVNGTVDGEILCRGTLTVGPRGLARANITADSVVIEGEVVGNVTVHGSGGGLRDRLAGIYGRFTAEAAVVRS